MIERPESLRTASSMLSDSQEILTPGPTKRHGHIAVNDHSSPESVTTGSLMKMDVTLSGSAPWNHSSGVIETYSCE